MKVSKIKESVQNPPETIRVGDMVVVTKPAFVERVGYPLSFDKAKQWVLENKLDAIKALLDFQPPGDLFMTEPALGPIEEEIVRSVAINHMRREGFGGRERTIHTRREEGELGRVYKVIDRKVVKTGLYYPASGYAEDWEPGGLDNCKTHVLLQLTWDWHQAFTPMFRQGLWIERCNVRRCKHDED